MDSQVEFQEVQFWELSKSAHVFNTCNFEYCGLQRLLIASRNHLLSLGSEWGKFSLQEMPLVGVPEDAEIMSVGGFVGKTSENAEEFYEGTAVNENPFIAVAFVKPNEHGVPSLQSPPMTPSSLASSPTFSFSNRHGQFRSGTTSGRESPALNSAHPYLLEGARSRPVPTRRESSESASSSAHHQNTTPTMVEHQSKYFLHIYSTVGQPVHDPMDLASVTQSKAQVMELGFLPLHLSHAKLQHNFKGENENYFVLSGADQKLHFLCQREGHSSPKARTFTTDMDQNSAESPHARENAQVFLTGTEFGEQNVAMPPTMPGRRNLSRASTESPYSQSGSSSQGSSEAHGTQSLRLQHDWHRKRTANGEEEGDGLYDDEEEEEEEDEEEDEDEEDVSSFHKAYLSRSSSERSRQLRVRVPSLYFEDLQSDNGPLVGFNNLPSTVLCFKTGQLSRGELFVAGCEGGELRAVARGKEPNEKEIKSVAQEKFNGPLPCVSIVSSAQGSDFVDVLVGGSLGFAAAMSCYCDENGQIHLGEPRVLPGSMENDSVLCCKSADINWDGNEEVLFGTYGQHLLAYRSVEEGDALTELRAKDQDKRTSSYVQTWDRQFAYPIFSIESGDFNQDGVDELVINTLKGVHILQPDLHLAADAIQLSIQHLEQLEDLKKGLESSHSSS